MKLELEIYGSLCETNTFTINGINAEYEEFGDKRDHDAENAEPYGCGNMKFIRYDVSSEILEKYGITKDEYDVICTELEEKLSFGCCGWCV